MDKKSDVGRRAAQHVAVVLSTNIRIRRRRGDDVLEKRVSDMHHCRVKLCALMD